MRREPLLAALVALLLSVNAQARPPAPASPPGASAPAPAAGMPNPGDGSSDEDSPATEDADASSTDADEDSPTASTPPRAAVNEDAFSYELAAVSPENGNAGKLLFTVEQNGLLPDTGFALVRARLENGPSRGEVTLAFTPRSGNGAVTRRLELGPRERRTVVLPVPSDGQGMLRVSAGDSVSDPMRVYFSAARGRTILMLGTGAQFIDVAGPAGAPKGNLAKAQVQSLPSKDLSGELAELVGYDAVVLADARLEDLSQAQARALEAYAATGGVLAVFKPGPGTAARLPGLDSTSDGPHRYGFGLVRLCSQRKGPCARALPGEVLARLPAVRPAGAYDNRGLSGSQYGPSQAKHFLLPQALPPVGRFLVILALFCIAIGPGSLLVARRRGPSMLLFTIPATALVTCAVIVGYSLVVDGFATHVHAMSFSLLDRQHDRVVTVGSAAFYANLAPRSARFGSTSAVVFPWADRKEVTLDWSEGATFGRDLVPARTYRELGVLSVDPSRARLVVKRDGNGARVQNALGAPIRSGQVRVGGKVFHFHDLADGGEARAEPGPESTLHGLEDADEELARFSHPVAELFGAPLAEREFAVVLEGPGPLPLGGLTGQQYLSQHAVRGEVE